MSRTLSINNSNAITNKFPGKNFSHVIVIDTGTSVTDTDWGISSGTIYWTDAGINNSSYLGFITEMSDIIEQFAKIIEDGGGVASGSSFSFSIKNVEINGDTFIDFCDDEDITLEGSEIKVNLFLGPDNSTALSDGNYIFIGKIKNVRWTYEEIIFECNDAKYDAHRKIVDTKINSDNVLSSGAIIPDETKNKTYPCIFGDMPYAKGILADKRAYNGSTNGQIVSFGYNSSYGANKEILNCYIWIDSIKQYCNLIAEVADIEYSEATNKDFIKFDDSGQTYAKNNGIFCKIYVKLIANGGTNATDIDNCVDDDFETYCYLASVTAPNSNQVDLSLPNYQFSDSYTIVKIYWLGKIETNSAAAIPANSNVDYQITGNLPPTTNLVILDSSDIAWDNVDDMDDAEDDKEYDAATKDLGFFFSDGTKGRAARIRSNPGDPGGSPETNPQIDIYDHKLRVDFCGDIETADFYANIQGLKDETPANYTAVDGSLVEEPQDLVYLILGQLLGISKVTHDHTLRNDWKFATQILEPTNSLEMIREICNQSFLMYYTKFDDSAADLRHKVIDINTIGTSVATLTIANQRFDDGKPTINEPVKKTSTDNIFNGFIVNYGWEEARQEYRKNYYVINAGTIASPSMDSNVPSFTDVEDYCEESIEKYQLYRVLEIDANWIQDDDTAALFIEKLAAWYCFQHYIFEIETAFMELLELELGDQVRITSDLLPAAKSWNGATGAMFQMYYWRHSPEKASQVMKFIEILELE